MSISDLQAKGEVKKPENETAIYIAAFYLSALCGLITLLVVPFGPFAIVLAMLSTGVQILIWNTVKPLFTRTLGLLCCGATYSLVIVAGLMPMAFLGVIPSLDTMPSIQGVAWAGSAAVGFGLSVLSAWLGQRNKRFA